MEVETLHAQSEDVQENRELFMNLLKDQTMVAMNTMFAKPENRKATFLQEKHTTGRNPGYDQYMRYWTTYS